MKYYSEETVKALLENVSLHTMDDCPSIEIPDEHGKLKDIDDVLNRLVLKPCHDAISTLLSLNAAIDESDTIVEASNGLTD